MFWEVRMSPRVAQAHGQTVAPVHTPEACRVREVLDLIADKWSLYVVTTLGDGPRRFTELKRGIDGISQRMLTVTLRGLERDGILTRTVHQAMPPHVSYELTALGTSLLSATAALVDWSTGHLPEIDAARRRYDRKQQLNDRSASAEKSRWRPAAEGRSAGPPRSFR
jgi:DNA-binding HxlR family transcriptional regulator